jgi:hypothetical protein
MVYVLDETYLIIERKNRSYKIMLDKKKLEYNFGLVA